MFENNDELDLEAIADDIALAGDMLPPLMPLPLSSDDDE